MLNDKIKQLRQSRNLSQVDIAKQLNVTKQSVSNWENDNIQPSIDMLIKLAALFSVSTDHLLGLDDKKYIEVTGLSDEELAHVQQIIQDIKKYKK